MAVYYYVSIIIALQVFVWSVVLWISDTLYTSKFLSWSLVDVFI